jgi:hypothetical protein
MQHCIHVNVIRQVAGILASVSLASYVNKSILTVFRMLHDAVWEQ